MVCEVQRCFGQQRGLFLFDLFGVLDLLGPQMPSDYWYQRVLTPKVRSKVMKGSEERV